MDILTIGKCLPYIAGPAVLAFEEAKMLVRMGHQVDFVTYAQYPSGAMKNFDLAILQRSGINFHFVEIAENDKVIGTSTETALLSAALRIAKTKKFDFVNAHFAIPHGLVAIKLAEVLDIPSVVTLHGSDVWTLPHQPQFDEVSRLVFQKASILITVSKSLRGETLELMEKARSIEVLEIGVDLKRFTPVFGPRATATTQPRFLFVGRLAKIKRLEVLIRAFEELLWTYSGAKLILAGVGTEEQNLQKLINELVIKRQVILVGGEYEGLPNLYQSADIFVLSSEKEGFPNSLCEAAASGLPIITTPVGSVPDYFEEGVHCLFAKIGDYHDLARQMKRLVESVVLRKAMAVNNLDLARKHFDLQKRCQRLLELVEKYKQGENK